MGRKVHPKGFRLKVIREWDARWYAEGQRFVNLLMEDRQIRRFIKSKTSRAGVSRIEIERHPNQVIITINTVRPGLIIGRKGEAVKELRQNLQDMTGKTVKVEVSEIRKARPGCHAGGGECGVAIGAAHRPQPRDETRDHASDAARRGRHSR